MNPWKSMPASYSEIYTLRKAAAQVMCVVKVKQDQICLGQKSPPSHYKLMT